MNEDLKYKIQVGLKILIIVFTIVVIAAAAITRKGEKAINSGDIISSGEKASIPKEELEKSNESIEKCLTFLKQDETFIDSKQFKEDEIKQLIGKNNIESGFMIQNVSGDTYNEVILIRDELEKDADETLSLLLNRLKDIKENEKNYEKDVFSTNNVVLKRRNYKKYYYTYLIISAKVTNIENIIVSNLK